MMQMSSIYCQLFQFAKKCTCKPWFENVDVELIFYIFCQRHLQHVAAMSEASAPEQCHQINKNEF